MASYKDMSVSQLLSQRVLVDSQLLRKFAIESPSPPTSSPAPLVNVKAPPFLLSILEEYRQKTMAEDRMYGTLMDDDFYRDEVYQRGEYDSHGWTFKKHWAYNYIEIKGLHTKTKPNRSDSRLDNCLVLLEQDGKCPGLVGPNGIIPCGAEIAITKDIHIDHIIELQHGGMDTRKNKQALCGDCHKTKTSGNTKKKLEYSHHQNFY